MADQDPGQLERRIKRLRKAIDEALDGASDDYLRLALADDASDAAMADMSSADSRADKPPITAEVAAVERRWRDRVEGLADRFDRYARLHRRDLAEVRDKPNWATGYLEALTAAAEAFEEAARDVRALLADRDDKTSDEGADSGNGPSAGYAQNTPDRQGGEGSVADGPSPEVMGDLSSDDSAEDNMSISAHTPDLPDEVSGG